MLLAIDVGNTHTVYGLWDGECWLATWRRSTSPEETEDQLAAWLHGMFALSGLEWGVEVAVCGSVVPAMNDALARLCEKWFKVNLRFLERGDQVGIKVLYNPPNAVGADRIANALGALARYEPPITVVDFGTATTFDAIDGEGSYAGGAILPGLRIGSQALFDRAAKLPQVDFVAPPTAIGKNTVHALQSGIVLGYAGAIDALARRIQGELGGGIVIATGGLGATFLGLCETLERYEATLTLEGLVIAAKKLA
ncbi:type III pantothenate kinase [bacterium]|nr:MAG: type III pantothenate kinase [bacterium]